MTSVVFSIKQIAAWAPQVETWAAWQAWAQQTHPLQGEQEPPLSHMPAMLRRRVGRLGKYALESAYQCLAQEDLPQTCPVVFSSHHGEASRSWDLLQELAQHQPLSPTSFGLSVHNAFAGLFSMARKDKANHSAISAGANSVEYAFIEASGLLDDGAAQVLVVIYEAPIPHVFKAYLETDEQPFAFAALITQPQADSPTYQLEISPDLSTYDLEGKKESINLVSAIGAMPNALQVLRFLIQDKHNHTLIRMTSRQRSCWKRKNAS